MQTYESRALKRKKTKIILLTGGLLTWFAVTFVVAYFAHDLSFDFFGWPFSFWVGAQGALVIYCLIVFIYALLMNRMDKHDANDSNSLRDQQN